VASVAPDYCPIFGVKLRYPSPEDVYTPNTQYPESASIDRIVPEAGYVPENIAIISRRANSIKNEGTAEEHRLIADWMDRNIPKPGD
jgi:hypothetical protein